MQYRQGDIFFEVVEAIPSEAVRSNSPIVAYGEVSGHSHTLTGSYIRYDLDSDIYLDATNVVVEHEEHGSIFLPSGKKIHVYRQRQYDPRTSIPVPVKD